MFILSAERDDPTRAPGAWWDTYQNYLAEHADQFPASAFALATSDWFHGNGHQAPHDGWLQNVRIQERDEAERGQHSTTSITIDLLGAYHDGRIRIEYRGVTNYKIGKVDTPRGLGDWRYDEFRLAEEAGTFVHEIEWWAWEGRNTWLIEAAEISHTWEPFSEEGQTNPA